VLHRADGLPSHLFSRMSELDAGLHATNSNHPTDHCQ
jgi:hypothetical protein